MAGGRRCSPYLWTQLRAPLLSELRTPKVAAGTIKAIQNVETTKHILDSFVD